MTRGSRHISRTALAAWTAAAICVLCSAAWAQRVAVIVPEPNETAEAFAERLAGDLGRYLTVSDRGAAEAAFRAMGIETPFNQTRDQARNAGTAIGADMIILVRAEIQPRRSFQKGEYQEAWASLFTVGSRSGKLLDFQHLSADDPIRERAEAALLDEAVRWAGLTAETLKAFHRRETERKDKAAIEDHSRATEETPGLRLPMPYSRIRPEYTPLAALFSVRATVDAEVDIDAEGQIERLEIVRWAGYGLDTAVTDAIRRMNWHPAERGGKTLPIRVLLRYNFTKIEKDDN
ncbi:MAG TPA: energy transducer TonB [Pyrinomonadaceae bacterium]|nr:energy transducer TonB [Pyrinomonadaceae bacterium]HMP64452.1 energy transducer TonB [Pyrinomonadaceae bacterium]